MLDLKIQLKHALQNAIPAESANVEIVVQDVPDNKPGDYGSPVAFQIAKILKLNPVQVAADIVQNLQLPTGIARVQAVGPFLNFFVDTSSFVQNVVMTDFKPEPKHQKVIIEHTSVNPNKEWHVGHIRGALIGDAMARIYNANGYEVEVQNYIDDTGRQAADSQFAIRQYDAIWDEHTKYDHWLGALYVRLHKDFENPEFKTTTESDITNVIHALERGELRNQIERVVKAQLETAYSLGIEYDLLIWESDVVNAGFVQKALDIFGDQLQIPTTGKYAGTKGVDLSPFVPGLEEPFKVLVRGNGTFVYETKDIAYHYWKFGLFEGLQYQKFVIQPSSKQLWTSTPTESHEPNEQRFAHANEVVNIIDARQSLAQMVVKAGLSLINHDFVQAHHHLANETVLLEGQTMSGRKGITVSADDVIAEAKARALAVTQALNPTLGNSELISKQVGLGALKFAFLKAEPKRQIDFRWEQALALQGDTAVVIQYAHARIRSIARKATSFNLGQADWSKIGELELKLARVIAKNSEVLAFCIRDNTPHPMCAYALELATAFNAYYNHKGTDGKSDTSVLHADAGLREARLMLVVRVADTIRDALGVLGIDSPEEM